jgi:hypothetical protein
MRWSIGRLLDDCEEFVTSARLYDENKDLRGLLRVSQVFARTIRPGLCGTSYDAVSYAVRQITLAIILDTKPWQLFPADEVAAFKSIINNRYSVECNGYCYVLMDTGVGCHVQYLDYMNDSLIFSPHDRYTMGEMTWVGEQIEKSVMNLSRIRQVFQLPRGLSSKLLLFGFLYISKLLRQDENNLPIRDDKDIDSALTAVAQDCLELTERTCKLFDKGHDEMLALVHHTLATLPFCLRWIVLEY